MRKRRLARLATVSRTRFVTGPSRSVVSTSGRHSRWPPELLTTTIASSGVRTTVTRSRCRGSSASRSATIGPGGLASYTS